MALNTAGLTQDLLNAFDKAATQTDNPQQGRQQLVADIAKAIDTFIRTAQVNVTITGASPSGPISGTGVGGLS